MNGAALRRRTLLHGHGLLVGGANDNFSFAVVDSDGIYVLGVGQVPDSPLEGMRRVLARK